MVSGAAVDAIVLAGNYWLSHEIRQAGDVLISSVGAYRPSFTMERRRSAATALRLSTGELGQRAGGKGCGWATTKGR